MNPAWLYLLAGLALVIGSAIQLGRPDELDVDEQADEPFGFNVVDGGVVDGGEPEWEEE
jgi:hypothetical protein